MQRRVHRDAPTILHMEATSGMSWDAIGARLRMDPMRARSICYDAVGLLVCDMRLYPELEREEAA